MNNITIAGPLGRDAETRFLPDGTPIASFSVADSQGKDKPTIWWSCSLFGKRAESLAPYLIKGQAVAVSGNVTEREYTDKDGNKRKAMDIRVADVALQGGKREGAAPAKPAAKESANAGGFDEMSDDIPFRDPLARRGYHLVV
jgi:single-strand DNA-binding protein